MHRPRRNFSPLHHSLTSLSKLIADLFLEGRLVAPRPSRW